MPTTNMNTTPTMTPKEIVHELDKFIIGQDEAKRAVAIALRNRWRRMQVDEELRPEITPKNIRLRKKYLSEAERVKINRKK